MADFFLNGYHFQNSKRKYKLKLPSARTHQIVPFQSESNNLKPGKLIKEAVRMRRQINHKYGCTNPYGLAVDGDMLHNSLQKILARHPFPLFQGPLIPPLDLKLYEVKMGREGNKRESEKRESEIVMEAKTIFNHNEKQKCGKWTPLKSGLEGWGNIFTTTSEVNTFKISNPENKNIDGAASSRESKAILYICNFGKCIIQCPCTICMNKENMCIENCKNIKCTECEYQCKEHQVKLPWTFNADTDQFTMITTNTYYFHFATPYAGIPVNCDSCTKDLLEHQILHLVVHLRCKYCSQDLKPFEKESIITNIDYRKAERKLIINEDRTCSICFLKCEDKKSRKNHEYKSHKIQNVKTHACHLCDKAYSNKNALGYHYNAKHKECSGIESAATKKQSEELEKSEELEEEEKFECEDCGKFLKYEKSLILHRKFVHRYTTKNLDYAPDDDDLFECSESNAKFLRKDVLRRHKDTVHKKRITWKVIICPSCGKEFSRKDSFTRHLRKQICKT